QSAGESSQAFPMADLEQLLLDFSATAGIARSRVDHLLLARLNGRADEFHDDGGPVAALEADLERFGCAGPRKVHHHLQLSSLVFERQRFETAAREHFGGPAEIGSGAQIGIPDVTGTAQQQDPVDRMVPNEFESRQLSGHGAVVLENMAQVSETGGQQWADDSKSDPVLWGRWVQRDDRCKSGAEHDGGQPRSDTAHDGRNGNRRVKEQEGKFAQRRLGEAHGASTREKRQAQNVAEQRWAIMKFRVKNQRSSGTRGLKASAARSPLCGYLRYHFENR